MNYIEIGPYIEEVLTQYSEARRIPNKYAATILGLSDLELGDDGYHYTRPLGPEHERFTKSIYSVPSEEMVKDVADHVMCHACNNVDYCWKQLLGGQTLDELIDDSYIPDESTKERIRSFGLGLFENFDELFWFVKEIPRHTIDCLRFTIQMLSKYFDNDFTVENTVSLGNEILDIVRPLEFLPYHEDIELDNN